MQHGRDRISFFFPHAVARAPRGVKTEEKKRRAKRGAQTEKPRRVRSL
jgi:hypothetical protein